MDGIPNTRLGDLPNLSYGHLFGAPENLPHLVGTGRSGLSPTFFSGPNEPLFPDEALFPLHEAERLYQKTKLAGYTSALLHAIGALDRPSVKAPNLTNEIHPMLDKPMWASVGTVDLENREDGQYHAWNPIVWNALLPSVRLASRFLENVHCWPWWDALVNGEQRWIPTPPAHPDRPIWSFHARDPDVILEEGFAADEEFSKLYRDRVRFMINVANQDWNDPETGRPVHATTMGYTQYLPKFDMSRITLASQMIAPLLRRDISDSQRLVIQFQIAKTILHEFAHAIGILLSVDEGILDYGEPFYEDEVVRELGESMEKAFFSGRIWSFPSNVSQRAYIMTAVQNWPNYALMVEKHSLGLGSQILPGSFQTLSAGAEQNVMAIPISWMESLFQEDFWAVYVRQFGADAVKPYPKLVIQSSVVVAIDPVTRAATRKAVTKFGADYNAYLAAKRSPEVQMGGSVVAELAYRMDGERVDEAYRQCAILEQALAWYWARTGVYGEA